MENQTEVDTGTKELTKGTTGVKGTYIEKMGIQTIPEAKS